MPSSKFTYDQPSGSPSPVVKEDQNEYGFIGKLQGLKYEYRADIRDRAALERNFREKFEVLNRVKLSDGEFARLLDEIVTPDVFTAAKTLRSINAFTREDGTPLNYMLVNIKDWCKNTFEVVNQLRINTDNSHHRYDVLILINGVPCVQIELKTLGINPRRAMEQIVDYKNDPGNGYTKTLLSFLQLFIVSNRTNTYYFANNNARHFAFNADERFLPIYQFADEANNKITQLDEFADKFLVKCTLAQTISRYMVLVASEQKLLMMRPYTITHAIEDANVLRFHVDYFKSEGKNPPKAGEVLAKRAVIEAILAKHGTATASRRFNAVLATASINDAIEYHALFQSQQEAKQKADPSFVPLNIACVFSPPADGDADVKQLQQDLPTERENNQEDPEGKKAALKAILASYNTRYGTNHSINEFDLYYQDVQKRIKDQQWPNADYPHAKKIDITIVVDMLLTGFDSKYLNTLYVDKNLKYHGLIQAFSRTNRVLNGTKPYGNILDFRQQQANVDAAIALFSGEKSGEEAREIWLVDKAPVVIEKLDAAVTVLADFMQSHLFKSGWVRTQIQKEAQGSKVLGISPTRLRNLRLPLPYDKAEQQKIADCLSSLDELIAAQARKVDALKTHKKGLMQQLFPREGETQPRLRFLEFRGAEDWVNSTLGAVFDTTSGGTPSRTELDYWDGNIPWISTSLVNFGVITEAEQYISLAGLKNSSAKLLPKGAVLIAMYGQGKTRGQVALLGVEATTNQACAAVLPKEGINPYFVFSNLAGRYEEFRKLSNSGGQENLSQALVRDFPLAYPADEMEQQRITNCLTSLDTLITATTQELETLKTHKKGLMQQLFLSAEEAEA